MSSTVRLDHLCTQSVHGTGSAMGISGGISVPANTTLQESEACCQMSFIKLLTCTIYPINNVQCLILALRTDSQRVPQTIVGHDVEYKHNMSMNLSAQEFGHCMGKCGKSNVGVNQSGGVTHCRGCIEGATTTVVDASCQDQTCNMEYGTSNTYKCVLVVYIHT